MSARYEEAVAVLGDEQHLLRLLEDEGYVGEHGALVDGARHAVQKAQALALLAIAEEVEALVELLRERLPAAAPVDYGPEEYPTALDVVDGPACVTCGVRRDLHDAERAGHAWNGGGSA